MTFATAITRVPESALISKKFLCSAYIEPASAANPFARASPSIFTFS